MNTQPKALRMAAMIQCTDPAIADELRRLHALNAELVDALKEALPALEAAWYNESEARKARAAIAKTESEKKNPGVL